MLPRVCALFCCYIVLTFVKCKLVRGIHAGPLVGILGNTTKLYERTGTSLLYIAVDSPWHRRCVRKLRGRSQFVVATGDDKPDRCCDTVVTRRSRENKVSALGTHTTGAFVSPASSSSAHQRCPCTEVVQTELYQVLAKGHLLIEFLLCGITQFLPLTFDNRYKAG